MKKLVRKMRNLAEFAIMAAKAPLTNPMVGDAPWFDEGGKLLFGQRIATAKALLEYGCGGSTVFAATNGLQVVSVETDARYASVVNAKLQSIGQSGKAQVYHANIGPTRKWGYPLSDSPTPTNVSRWLDYTARPWREAKLRGVHPDVVLVDGRFRVACVIRSLIEMDELGLAAPILLDDYEGRDEYTAVLGVCTLVNQSGRMAELQRKPGVTAGQLRQALDASIVQLR